MTKNVTVSEEVLQSAPTVDINVSNSDLSFSSVLKNKVDCFFFSPWVNERKKQRHSAITIYIVVKGGTALVCTQAESQLQRLCHSY